MGYLSERVRPQAPTRRQVVQVGVSALHVGATHSLGDRKGQEPMAQRRCPLWCSPPVLWNEGDELLHSFVRSVKSSWSHSKFSLGQSPWSSLGETQVNVNSWTQEIGRCMNEFEILINTTISYQWTIFCTFVRYPPGESLNLVF